MAATASASAATALFQRYEDALNRHDHDAVSAFWKPGVVRIGGGKRVPVDRARWKGYRDFEAATRARFSLRTRVLADGRIEIVQREDCDFYRALGSDTKSSVFIVRLDGERIAEVESGPASDSGADYAAALDALKAWVLREHPERAAEVLSNGIFVFDARSAPHLLELANAWRAQQARAQ